MRTVSAAHLVEKGTGADWKYLHFSGITTIISSSSSYEDGSAQILLYLLIRNDMPGTPVPRAYASLVKCPSSRIDCETNFLSILENFFSKWFYFCWKVHFCHRKLAYARGTGVPGTSFLMYRVSRNSSKRLLGFCCYRYFDVHRHQCASCCHFTVPESFVMFLGTLEHVCSPVFKTSKNITNDPWTVKWQHETHTDVYAYEDDYSQIVINRRIRNKMALRP